MYTKLLQIYILGISIYVSIELPSPDEPPNGDKNDDYNHEAEYDAGANNNNTQPDYGSVDANNAGPDIDNAAGYDEVQPDDKPADANGDVADLENDGTNAGATYSDTNDGVKDNAESGDAYDDSNAGAYDDSGQNEVAYANAENDYDDAGKEYDYKDDSEYAYSDKQSNYGSESYEDNGGGLISLNMQDSTEILDRNSPEPGFDLSYSEMMKLKMWPDALIPYYIDVYSFNDKVMRDKIRSFLSSVNSLTALNFVELPSPPNNNIRWVFFVNRRGLLGCADHSIRNFTNAGVQQVVLGYHCMSTEGELAEAVLAIAGVPAQHNAPDRDYYIKINEENIIPEKKFLFEKRSDDEWLFHDLQYDFNSAGHFHMFKHSINGRATIELQTKIANTMAIGESKVLTASDILKIRMLYNFIVKKKLLQAPDCYKLFEPGKKFNQYQPSDQQKPRPKPFRYTGESPDAPLDADDVEVDPDQHLNDNNNADINVENPNMYPDAEYVPVNDTSTDYDISEPTDAFDENYDSTKVANEHNPSVDYNDGIPDKNNYPNQNAPQEEADNYSSSDFNNNGKKPIVVNIKEGQQSIAQMAAINHVMTLKAPNKSGNKESDLLTVLSDFQTDEEVKPRKKEALSKQPHKIVNLKFTAIG